ncbi:MAG TPA: endolytic transglycosylase MltG, partial [bacterium]|nr:endolytic transglycosylase MltG [bacterium]
RDEQPRIAAVFLNRLRKGMKLQSDPTVIYGKLPAFNGNLTRTDLETDHPHNTYTRQGIPPTPIAAPGETAIRSVLEPATTDELFFVATGGGAHHFSVTYEEHSAAVEHYQVKELRTPFVWKKR